MKTIFLIAGESGSGKDSLVNELCRKHKLKSLLSYTTRPRRINEGDTHIFINPDEVNFYEKDIIAKTEINNAIYFATKHQLKNIDFYIIDEYGIKELKKKIKPEDNIRFITILIHTPFSLCYERAMIRGDDKGVYLSRRKSEKAQFDRLYSERNFDYAVSNYDFHKALDILETIIKVEGAC